MIELYINNNKVDIDRDIDIAMTYSSVDTSSPEAIKNSFSKSIELKGTATNNKLFGDIYQFDRSTIESDDFYGSNFDARKRVDFVLYNNGDIVDKGYFCLDSISIDGKDITYSITLYGQLGDFFYNLQSTDDGEEKTLADLIYPQGDFTINWNKDFIYTGWNSLRLNNSGNNIWNKVVAVPSYSGNYDDFDNDVVLVNHYDELYEDKYLPTNKHRDDDPSKAITATTKFGWSIYKCDRDLDEWECRDLRSQYQRPAIKLEWILDAISDPQNNGGYTLQWDNDVKNSAYYNNTWVMLGRLKFDDYEDLNKINEFTIQEEYTSDNNIIGYFGEIATDDSGVSWFTPNDDYTYEFNFDLILNNLTGDMPYYTYSNNISSRNFGISFNGDEYYVDGNLMQDIDYVQCEMMSFLCLTIKKQYYVDSQLKVDDYAFCYYSGNGVLPYDKQVRYAQILKDKTGVNFKEVYFTNIAMFEENSDVVGYMSSTIEGSKNDTNISIYFNITVYTILQS